MVNATSPAPRSTRFLSPARIAKDYAFVMPGFVLSLFAFVLLVPLTALSIGTFVVWIGALLLPFTLQLASAFAALSRARLRSWGVALPPARYAPAKPGFAGLLAGIADPRRWLDLAFETIIAFPLRIFTFVVATTWTAGAAAGITYWRWASFLPQDDVPLAGLILGAMTAGAAPDVVAQSFLLDAAFNFVVGCVFLLTLPFVMRGLARLDAATTAAALGGVLGASETTVPDAQNLRQEPPSGNEAHPGPGRALSGTGWTWIVAAFAAIVSVSINWPVLGVLYGVPVVIAMLISFAHATALLLAVRVPAAGIAVHAAAAVATVFAAAAGALDWPWPWPVMPLIIQSILILLVALRSTWPWAAAAWLAPQLVVALATLALGMRGGAGSSLIVASSVSLGVLIIGVIIRQLMTSRGALQEERRTSADLDVQRKELEERNRIAQELHDVVAHSMSVISVQATTAKYRLPGLDPAAEREFSSIAESSRQALSEMRSLLALLRSTDDDREVPLAPQPTIADIPALVEATRQSGARILLRMPGDGSAAGANRATVPAATGLTAYRIVQEALSNAMRHSPGSEIGIVVEADQGIVIDVVNGPADEANPQPAAPGAGLGLAGVRERTNALGGSVEAGPTETGGFRVRAVLPLA